MFKSISNNFGAPEITFQDFQNEKLIILNAHFQIDPANTDYKAAKELEIKVPDLAIDKSTDAGVFATYEDSHTFSHNGEILRYHFPVLLRSRIKDKNTLCIEKIPDYDEFGPIHIYIYAAYFVLNTGELTQLMESTPLTFTYNPQPYSTYTRSACVVTDDWVWLYINFPYEISDVDEDMEITVDGLPADVVCDEFPIMGVNNQSHYDNGGIHYASLRDSKVSVPYATKNFGCSSADEPFLYLYLVRNTASADGQTTE